MTILRVNSNTTAENSLRHLTNNSSRLAKNIEKVSSGLKINRGADGPADLVISEKLRGKIASLTQAISNNEISVSMIQTAESAMDEINKGLVRMRQLAIHASNEGANDESMLKADQMEYDSIVSQLDRIAKYTTFGSKQLLTGSYANMGATTSKGLDFIQSGVKAVSSGEGPYNVMITQSATNAFFESNTKLDEGIIEQGELLKIREGGKTIELTTEVGDTAKSVVSKLNASLKRNDMKIEVSLTGDDEIQIKHKLIGSAHSFQIYSSTEGLFSREAGQFLEIKNGQDIAGNINGESIDGEGEYLTGAKGTRIEGMKLRYVHQGEEPISDEDGVFVGSVTFEQNSLKFQIGSDYGQTISFRLPGTFSDMLGRNVNNDSQFNSLAEVDLKSFQGAQDSLLLIDKAINEITLSRGELGAVQKYSLESNHRFLMSARENIINAESIIRDTDMAKEVSDMTKNSILSQATMAALSHANKNPQTILTLLQ